MVHKNNRQICMENSLLDLTHTLCPRCICHSCQPGVSLRLASPSIYSNDSFVAFSDKVRQVCLNVQDAPLASSGAVPPKSRIHWVFRRCISSRRSMACLLL